MRSPDLGKTILALSRKKFIQAFALATMGLAAGLSHATEQAAPTTVQPSLPFLNPNQVIDFQSGGGNLLSNGSFELGLGAEPFYPGWGAPRGENVPTDAPQEPVLDSPGANASRHCLKIGGVNGRKHAFIDVSPPPVTSVPGAEHFVSVWVRTSAKAQMLISMENCQVEVMGKKTFTVDQTWKQCVLNTKVSEEHAKTIGWVPHVRIEVWTNDDAPFDVWYDDIQWSQTAPPKNTGRAPLPGPVDAVLVPAFRTGIYPANKPIELAWAAESVLPRRYQMELHLLDVSRAKLSPGTDNSFTLPWHQIVVLGNSPSAGKIPVGILKRGSYMALLAVRDAMSGSLLAVTRERFSVMADLRDRPPIVDFNVGTYGGLTGWGGGPQYHWRGFWTTDEYYKLSYYIGLRAQRLLTHWTDIEPVQGEYNWYFKNEMELANKHHCETILYFPQDWPERITKTKYEEILKSEDSSKGNWLIKKSRVITEVKDEVILAPPVEDLKRSTIAFAELVKGKVSCITVQNESNLRTTPEVVRDSMIQYVYPIFKEKLPDIPVLINVCSDFGRINDVNWAERYFNLETKLGASVCDGFSYHPYQRCDLQEGGLTATRKCQRVVRKYAPLHNKPLVFAQDEVDTRATDWNYMQRFLMDWLGGSRWSVGQTFDLTSFYEVGTKTAWGRRGTYVAGSPDVAINAMWDVLAGTRILDQAEQPDFGDKILCALSSSKDGHAYAVAMCAANDPGHFAVIKAAGLAGLPVTAFDMWGEPIPLSEEIVLGHNVTYLRSTDSRLHEVLRKATATWYPATSFITQMNPKPPADNDFRYGGPETKYLLRNGVSRQLEQGVAWNEWLIKGSSPDVQTSPSAVVFSEGTFTQKLNDSTKDARLPDANNPTVNIDRSVNLTENKSTVSLANADVPMTPGSNTWWLKGMFVSPEATQLRLNLSWMGADRVELWIDQQVVASIPGPLLGDIGGHWMPLPLFPVKQGVHTILLRLHRSGAQLMVGVKTGCPTDIDRVQMPGVIISGDQPGSKGNDGIENLTDQNIDTKYVSAARDTVPLVFQFSDERAYAISGYSMTSAGDAPQRDPRRWTFEGAQKKDGPWVVLDRHAKDSWEGKRKERLLFNCDNTTPYHFYRLTLSNTNEGDSKSKEGVGLAELELLDSSGFNSSTPVPPRDVMFDKTNTFNGQTSSFAAGNYLASDLEPHGLGNDKNPIFLRVPKGFIVTLYAGDVFSGGKATYAAGIYQLSMKVFKSMKIRMTTDTGMQSAAPGNHINTFPSSSFIH